MDRCDGCGFVYDLTLADAAADDIVNRAGGMAGILVDREDAAVARRPQADTWSVLEYCCHVRDVLLVQRERVLLALREDRPDVATMGRDERVEADGYNEQRPVDVARQLEDAALMFTGVLRRLDGQAWERTLMYNYPEPAERSLRWVAVHTLHEVTHHLGDVQQAT
jgi:hypothetical protein